MAEPIRKPDYARYDEDFSAWSEEQSRMLREGGSAGLDWKNLAEEIEGLGSSQRREIRNRLVVLLHHLLKWEHQPEKRKLGWRASILEARTRLNQELADSPSLRGYPLEVLETQYGVARLRAAAETKRDLEAIPVRCPYSVSEILDYEFFPGQP